MVFVGVLPTVFVGVSPHGSRRIADKRLVGVLPPVLVRSIADSVGQGVASGIGGAHFRGEVREGAADGTGGMTGGDGLCSAAEEPQPTESWRHNCR